MADRWRDNDRDPRGYRGGYSGEGRREGRDYGDARDSSEHDSFTSGPRYSQGSNTERYGVDERSLYQNWGGDDRGRSYDYERGASRNYGDYRPDRSRYGRQDSGRQDWRGSDLSHGHFEGDRRALDYDYGATGASYGQGRSGGSYEENRGPRGGGDRYRDGYGDYGRSGYGGAFRGGGRDDDRGFLDRAGDEVRSWFGDDEAEQRRSMDQYRGHGPRGYTRSDERIREDVCDLLSDDPRIDASDIEVQVSSGEVTLTGNVRDRQAKRRVEDRVEDISGVKNVQNNLRVQQQGWASTGAATGTPAGSNSTSTLPSPSSSKRSDTL